MEAEKIQALKGFVEFCKQNPHVLHSPSLAFFKNFLQSFGARIPAFGGSSKDHEDIKPFDSRKRDTPMDDISDDDIVESDVELDNSDIVDPDNDPPQKMGDPSVEVSEENKKAAYLSQAKAMEAMIDGKVSETVDYLTEAVTLSPNSAIFYGTKVFIRLKKPNAAIRDADAALEINPVSEVGYKCWARGKRQLVIYMLHQIWILTGEVALALKKVEPNAKKIEEHNRKYKRLRKDKKLRRIELERKRRQDAESSSVLKDGETILIHSGSELEEKLNAASKTSRLSVLYFTTTWCGPYRYVGPVFTSLAGRYHLKVVFLKVDIDEAKEVAAEWNISSIPTFFFIRNGKEVDQLVTVDKNALEQKIARHA